MGRMRVRDVMTADVVTVGEAAGYREIVELLARHRISGVPVLDAEGRLRGVVSETDLLARVGFAGDGDPAVLTLLRRQQHPRAVQAGADLARELMSAPAITIEPNASVPAAARLMQERRVRRLPVVDAEGRLVGIVSRGDLLRVHLRADETIRAAVESQVLWEWFRVRPPQVRVRVHEGVVTLDGELDHRRQIPLAVHLTRAVDGVLDVVDRLTYRVDDDSLVGGRPG